MGYYIFLLFRFSGVFVFFFIRLIRPGSGSMFVVSMATLNNCVPPSCFSFCLIFYLLFLSISIYRGATPRVFPRFRMGLSFVTIGWNY